MRIRFAFVPVVALCLAGSAFRAPESTGSMVQRISAQSAAGYISRYVHKVGIGNKLVAQGCLLHKGALAELFTQADCAAVRCMTGWDGEQRVMMMVPLNRDGKEILSSEASISYGVKRNICPPNCDFSIIDDYFFETATASKHYTISIATANRYADTYANKYPNDPGCCFTIGWNNGITKEILNNRAAMGLRVYYGLESDNKTGNLLITGTDGDGRVLPGAAYFYEDASYLCGGNE